MFEPHRYYYLHNFQRAMDWISERYFDLLDASERMFLSRFAQLSQGSQALLVRMLMRRGPWFLQSKLDYEEIPDVGDAVLPLLNLGWLDALQPLGLAELFALHTKAELLGLFANAPVHSGMRKAQMLEALRPLDDVQKTYASWNPQTPCAALRVMLGEQDRRFRLMFFGNLRQAWSEFVLADLGIFQYEEVKFDPGARAFQSRADVDCYLELDRCRQQLDDGAEICTVLLALTHCVSANPWLQTRRDKLFLHLGQTCERLQDWDQAEAAYLQSAYPGARHRRMRVYERTKRYGQALNLAKDAQAAPESEEESQRVQRMLPRLARRLGIPRASYRRWNAALPQMYTVLELAPPEAPSAVEYVLRDHWQSVSAPVFYVENALINSLFGLLCWDALFAALPGAFFHPFQRGPADWRAADFVARRLSAFYACLGQLDDGTYCDTIRTRYGQKFGVQSPWVVWGALPEPLVELSLTCIPAAHLKLFFLRLLRNIEANRTGLPDLVRFWPAERRYELVEVKGPGDKLQDNQVRWLQYFHQHGIPASVCHVRWREAPDALQPQQSGARQVAA